MRPHYWRQIPTSLLVRTGLVAAAWLVGILGLYFWLRPLWPAAGGWVWGSLAAAAAGLGLLFWHLPDNHRPGEGAVLPTLGWGNGLTLTRGLLLAGLTGFLVAGRPEGSLGWLPAIFYTAAALLDFLDGLAARLTNHATRLGEVLDLEYDSYGVGLIVLLAITFGQVGWWLLLVAVARYWFVLGLWWRRRRGRPVRDLAPSRYRRVVAGYNMGLLTVLLWPILTPEAATLGALVFTLPFLILFWRDWLVVSDRLDPQSSAYRLWHGRARLWVTEWLPFPLRLLIAVTTFSSGLLPPAAGGDAAWRALLDGWGWPPEPAAAAAELLGWLAAAALLALVLGFWARWLALGALLPVALYVIEVGVSWVSWDSAALAAAVCGIALANSGRFSLWRPAEEGVFRQVGGP